MAEAARVGKYHLAAGQQVAQRRIKCQAGTEAAVAEKAVLGADRDRLVVLIQVGEGLRMRPQHRLLQPGGARRKPDAPGRVGARRALLCRRAPGLEPGGIRRDRPRLARLGDEQGEAELRGKRVLYALGML